MVRRLARMGFIVGLAFWSASCSSLGRGETLTQAFSIHRGIRLIDVTNSGFQTLEEWETAGLKRQHGRGLCQIRIDVDSLLRGIANSDDPEKLYFLFTLRRSGFTRTESGATVYKYGSPGTEEYSKALALIDLSRKG